MFCPAGIVGGLSWDWLCLGLFWKFLHTWIVGHHCTTHLSDIQYIAVSVIIYIWFHFSLSVSQSFCLPLFSPLFQPFSSLTKALLLFPFHCIVKVRYWVAEILQYICLTCRCDADPSALANYVVALVKKDKPEKELKALCADQLDVFLQKGMNSTQSFSASVGERNMQFWYWP